jgi:amidase
VTDDQLAFLDAYTLAGLLHSKKLSSVELTQMMLNRIERVDKRLLSYATVSHDIALKQARDADAMIMRRQILSPLHGVPVALKDLCYTKDIVTAAGMPMMRDFKPAYDGTVVKRLREAGTVLLGKLTMTEAAFADHHPDVPPPSTLGMTTIGRVHPRAALVWLSRRDCVLRPSAQTPAGPSVFLPLPMA